MERTTSDSLLLNETVALDFVGPCGHDDHGEDDAEILLTTSQRAQVAQYVFSGCSSIRPEFRVAFKDSWKIFYRQYGGEIDKILEECISKGSFDRLRSIGLLRITPESEESATATRLAWKSPYQGSYADTLVNTIRKEHRPYGGYANYLVAIQSSGAGKSRTAHEAGKSLFSVSVNLREKQGTGYPLRDDALCDFIGRAPRPLYERKTHCAAFIAGIFIVALSILNEGEITPLAFRKRLDDARVTFDKEAAEKATELLEQISSTKPAYDQYSDMVCGHTRTAIENFAKAAKTKDVVLFPIDNCHTLYSEIQVESTYHALCRVLTDLDRTPIFVLFMSTASNTPYLPPPSLPDPSARAYVKYLTEQQPYTSFPFDVYQRIITEDKKTLDDVCTVSFLCQLGRPLWATRWESGNETVKKDLINFAVTKLNCDTNPIFQVGKKTKFAALSFRHSLMFEHDRPAFGVNSTTYEETTALELSQVASHMRTVDWMPSHRKFMYTSTPPEPILAEAAAQLLVKAGRCENMLPASLQVQFLANELNPLVCNGERGELAARLLFNFAHDAALKGSKPIDDSLQFSRPIPLIDFLQALIAPEWHEDLLGSRPVTGGNLPFSEAFSDCWVNFTHWSTMGDASSLTTTILWMAIARGTALQCCEVEDVLGVDHLIPFVRGRHAKLGRGTVSVIAIQSKDRMTAVSLDREFPARIFADAPSATQQSFIFLKMRWSAVKSTKTATLDATPFMTPDTSPGRYDITVNGCSNTVYQAIEEDDRAYWAQLLTVPSLMTEFPRQTPVHVELLLRSKPFFIAGPHSFDWSKGADNTVDDNGEQDQASENVQFGKTC